MLSIHHYQIKISFCPCSDPELSLGMKIDNRSIFQNLALFLGLELNKEFPLAKFLSDANIVPGAVYQTEDILQAVKSQLNVSKMKILVISDQF